MEAVLLAIHVLAAAVWVGGTIALVFVAIPVVRRLEGAERAAALAAMGRRWRPIGWSALIVLAASGAGLVTLQEVDGAFGAVLAVKLVLVAGIAVLAYLHDFVLGPGLARQIRAGAPQTLRRPLVLIGRTTLVLSIVVPVLGVALARLAHT